jgi:hypothetical protein
MDEWRKAPRQQVSTVEKILLLAGFPAASVLFFLPIFIPAVALRINYLLSAVIFVAILVTIATIVVRRKNVELRIFLTLLLGFLILIFIGDVILTLRAVDENVVSIADYCWLSSYPFILSGGIYILVRHWRFKISLSGKVVLFSLAAIAILIIGYVSHNAEGSSGDLTIFSLTTIVIDFINLGVLIAIGFKDYSLRTRVYWSVVICALFLMTIGDIYYFSERLTHHYLKYDYSDSIYLTSYFLFIFGAQLAIRFRSEDNPENWNKAKALMENKQRENLLKQGLVGSIAPIVLIGGVHLSMELFAVPKLERMISRFFIAVFVVLFTWVLMRVEGSMKAKEYYGKSFEEYFDKGMDPKSLRYLESFANSLELTSAQVKKIERKIVRAKELDLRFKEIVFMRNEAFDRTLEGASKRFHVRMAKWMKVVERRVRSRYH